MGEFEKMCAGPYKADDCNEICPGLEHCVVDTRLPLHAQTVCYACNSEDAQRIAGALNFTLDYKTHANAVLQFVLGPR